MAGKLWVKILAGRDIAKVRERLDRAAVIALAALVAAALASCKGRDQPRNSAAEIASTAPAAPHQPLTADVLAPVIRERALPGELPDRIVIELARDAAPQGSVGRASAKTTLSTAPPSQGVITWESASTLSYRPSQPLDYDTRYAVAVEQIETRDGAVVPRTPWTREFQTPRFGLVRLELDRLAPGKAGLDVVFSGPVRAESVAPFLSWELNGQRLQGVTISATERPHVLRATVSGGRVAAGATIRLALREGAPARKRGTVAPAAQAEVAIPGGEPLTIRAAHLREGGTGFYLEVVCDDAAAKGARRHYWDPHGNEAYLLSRRCVLSAEDLARVRTSPVVKVSIAPGPAGFRLFGDFERGPLSIAIDGGARSEDGGVLQGAWQSSFVVPARRPALAFASGGRYLPRSAWRSLPLSHLNVDEAVLTVRQIPPENLVFWLSEERNERATERTSDVLLRKTLAFHGPQDRQATTWVDVASLLPATTKGVLDLALEAQGARTTARILLTGMNLVAKRSAPPKERWKQEVRVWALDMDSTDLLSGVDVALVRRSGKVVARCSTSGEDGCRLETARDDADDSEPFALVARKGDDLSYVRYADLRTDTSDADVAGEPFAEEAAYRAALFTERGVYRPGDVAHLAAVVRDREHRAPPAGMPLELRLVDPREKVARKIVARTNEAGLVAVDLPFGASAETGRYQVVALVAERRVGAHAFNVEEFVPERMKVAAAAGRAAYLLGEAAQIGVDARYLFGGSAEGSSVELTCALEPAGFRPARENAQFFYGPRTQRAAPRPLALGSAAGKLDEHGRASLACPPGPSTFAGPARLVASAAVFEGGSGRSSVAQATAAVHPEKYYLGLQSGARRAEAGKPIAVKGVVVDWAGAVQAKAVREVAIELIRLEPEYGWWWDDEEGGERFERHLRPVSEGARTVTVEGGRFAADLSPGEGGASYLVRARAGQALTEIEIEGDARGWSWRVGEAREQTPRPLRPSALALDLPRTLKVGERAVLKVAIPFRGRALFTVETDRVVSAEWRKVEPGELSWPFTLHGFSPNVYASVFLVKDPHLESREAFLPERAFGVASAAVEPGEFTAPLALDAPAEVRSSSALWVKLDVGPVEGPTFALVAAVDEGTLQLTRMKSPDPLEAIFAKRALGVDTFETVGWTLLVPPQGPSRQTGGDAAGPAGRVQPVKPVALWSGLVPVGPDGKAVVKLDVPQYRGQLRVMAVTAGPRRMGRASASVTVRDPIVLSTTLPRFVTQGDLLQIPVFVTNLSGARQEVEVTLAAEPLPVPGMAAPPRAESPLVFVGRSAGSARLADGASATRVFQVRAAVAVGAAKLRVVARAGPHESREELDVPFLPGGPRERIVKRLEVGGDAIDLTPHLEGWQPTSERTTFWLTANPYGESFDHLKELVHYPYGCVEQTTSSTRPLLFVANLVDSVDPAFTAGGKLDEMVMAGVQRLLSMQTPAGGLAYWPGGAEPYGFGTAYATHLLLDAQKAGYPVPPDRLDEILKWIEAEVGALERGERRGPGSYDDGPSGEAYLHYVLAAAGKGHKARIQQLIADAPARRDNEALEREYMLKAALYLAGDRRYEKDLRHPDASPVLDDRRRSWSFYSDRRRRGFMLSTFQDLFGDDPAGEALAQRVADSLKEPSGHYNTQELAWSVTGLGKRVGAVAREFEPGRLLAEGKPIEPRPPQGRAGDRTWSLARASEYRSLSFRPGGSGRGSLFLIVSSEGVRAEPSIRYGGSGLALSRTFRTADGALADPRGREVPLASLLFVEITLRNTSGERIHDLALVDRIPAGFEIENPRLGRAHAASWIDPAQLWSPDHLDVRDHQLAAFGKLEPGEARTLVYAVRAVTAGAFTLPPLEAEAMYDPRIWAREAGGAVKVTGPWKDDLL